MYGPIKGTSNSLTSSLFTKSKVKKAVILAGGQRTKLAPLNNCRPTWMFPVLNKPLMWYTINFLRKNGFEEVIVVLPFEDEIPEFLKNNVASGIDVKYHKESRPRGTAGTLKDIEDFIKKESFLVIGSSLFAVGINLTKFIRFHMESNSIATIGIHKDDTNGSEDSIMVANDGTVRSFYTIHSSINRRSPYKSSSIYLFKPSVLDFIDYKNYMDLKEQLMPILQKEGFKVSACEVEGGHTCISSLKDYMNLHRSLFENGYRNYINGMSEVAEGVWVGKDVKISPNAYLLGPIIIGDGCTIENGAQIIGPAVVGNGCQISRDVLIREGILWDGISLSSGARIEYSIVGEGANISSNSHVKNMLALNGLKIGDVNLIPSDYSIKGIVDVSNVLSITGNTHKIYMLLKRIIDAALSFIGIALSLPLFLLISIAIKIDSSGPVLYIQKRSGRGGKLFGMIKFRTMVTNAEKLHQELISQKDTDGPMFKMVDDPRVTRFGRFLRNTSLDELPQLWNVLKGEMSLIGPRPLIMDEMKFSPSWRETRLKVKPGITGLWQVRGRGEAPFHDWIRYDVSYVKNQSLWLDIKILFKTIKVVLKKIGAY